jgi:hypothetical protein
MKKIILFSSLFILLTTSFAFGQGSVTLTTYYPAPYGAYDRLRLVPRAAITLPCQIGTTFALSPTGALQYCGDYNSDGIGELGPIMGVWTQNANNVYLTNGATNPNLNVGIGTITPAAKLTLQGGAILATGTAGATPVAGAGTRFMWIPARAALRAGVIGGTEWDDANIGNGSVGLGTSSLASGADSFAVGGGEASGARSIALGLLTRARSAGCVAIGEGVLADRGAGANGWSVAIGHSSQASGDNAVALGVNSFADATNAVAIGACARPVNNGDLQACAHANASPSLALGMGFTFWNAPNSIAIGYSRVAVGSDTAAWAQESLALGFETRTFANGSTAIGHSTRTGVPGTPASGQFATALGHNNQAEGTASIAIGETANAFGNNSAAIGRNVTVGVTGVPATGQSSFSLGHFMNTTGSNSLGINMGNNGQVLTQNNSMAVMGMNRVGIGTTTPLTQLHLNETTAPANQQTPVLLLSDSEIATGMPAVTNMGWFNIGPTVFGAISDANWGGNGATAGGLGLIGFAANANWPVAGVTLVGIIGEDVGLVTPAVTIDGYRLDASNNFAEMTNNERVLAVNSQSAADGDNFVVLANGNVGVGFDNVSTSVPTQRLHVRDVVKIEPRSTAQPTCNAAAAGSFYVDGNTSNTLCYCNGTAPWKVVSGTVCD